MSLLLGTRNIADQAVAVGGIINLGNIYRKYCKKNANGVKAFDFNGTSISLQQSGIYHVTATIVVTSSAAGNVTIQLLENGVVGAEKIHDGMTQQQSQYGNQDGRKKGGGDAGAVELLSVLGSVASDGTSGVDGGSRCEEGADKAHYQVNGKAEVDGGKCGGADFAAHQYAVHENVDIHAENGEHTGENGALKDFFQENGVLSQRTFKGICDFHGGVTRPPVRGGWDIHSLSGYII